MPLPLSFGIKVETSFFIIVSVMPSHQRMCVEGVWGDLYNRLLQLKGVGLWSPSTIAGQFY